MFVALEGISKSYGGSRALSDVSFSAEQGDMVTLIGPSGAGKTTLLTIVAGLETPDGGRVRFASPPGRERPVILVFQDYVLFPHMNVAGNVGFGLRARKVGRAETRRRVTSMLEAFGIGDKARAYPAELSAGQRQRVAIARAMVVNPWLLLLDEPFANLDRNLKMETARFIRRTQKHFGVTTLSVTHDLQEAFVMSDRLGVMIDGRLEQFGSVDEVYHRPASIPVAEFLGPVNRIGPGLARALGVAAAGGNGDREWFARPEALGLAPDPAGEAVVRDRVFAGHYIVYTVEVGGEHLTVYSLSDSMREGDRAAVRLVGRLQKHEEVP